MFREERVAIKVVSKFRTATPPADYSIFNFIDSVLFLLSREPLLNITFLGGSCFSYLRASRECFDWRFARVSRTPIRLVDTLRFSSIVWNRRKSLRPGSLKFLARLKKLRYNIRGIDIRKIWTKYINTSRYAAESRIVKYSRSNWRLCNKHRLSGKFRMGCRIAFAKDRK